MENEKNPLRSLLNDQAVLDELREGAGGLEAAGSGHDTMQRLLEGSVEAIRDGAYTQPEAIILLRGRPALLVQDGKWETPSLKVLRDRLSKSAGKLEDAIRKVGRIEIINGDSDYIGTGWMIDEDVMITNRHVAEVFTQSLSGGGFTFRTDAAGQLVRVRVDFLREHDRSAMAQTPVRQVVYLENDALQPDMALIRLDKTALVLPPPLELDTSVPVFDSDNPLDLAAIGYPARDHRNDAFSMSDIFGSVFDVKRLSPGRLMGVRPDGKLLEHDATTLGGSSGSPIVDLVSGRVRGLHFSGSYRKRNLAASANWIGRRLAQLSTRTISLPATTRPVGTGESQDAPGADAARAEAVPLLDGRKGYQADFLGNGYEVDLPVIPADLESKIAAVADEAAGELRYTHFSVVLRSDRRLPFFTAVNIDGERLFNFVRGRDRWYPDPRLKDPAHQTDADLYAGNKLDRGHLVRRLDPAWGHTREEAHQAELDTFFMPNCSPQHSSLNQRTWLSLEDYVLRNADTRDLKVSVFSGPVMRDEDPVYRGVALPQEYWKVVVLVDAASETLSATGYLLSQADYLDDIEFVFGAFRTYQVPISRIAELTGLGFALEDYDPLAVVESRAFREIRSADDLIL